MLIKLFIEINRERIRVLKLKLQDAGKINFIGMAIFKDA